ncbi:hypothetical protein [Parablautia sp. Marseille-Q6255]|uniref:hypothetical protein n=1 Tax=Parablautia sp. Marseille-Q6255 TaxID=3039593 RepID=UPI0024BC9946|nr:hypothetical protein [Parablautia sp. Marseille-Q6255]
MITVFNRESIYIGTDMRRFSKIRDILACEGIDYTYKVSNPMDKWAAPGAGTMRSRMGGFAAEDTYEVFVHKKDYEKAKYVLREHGV